MLRVCAWPWTCRVPWGTSWRWQSLSRSLGRPLAPPIHVQHAGAWMHHMFGQQNLSAGRFAPDYRSGVERCGSFSGDSIRHVGCRKNGLEEPDFRSRSHMRFGTALSVPASQISFEPGLSTYQSLAQKIEVPFFQDFLLISAVLRVRGRKHNPRQTLVRTKVRLKHFLMITTDTQILEVNLEVMETITAEKKWRAGIAHHTDQCPDSHRLFLLLFCPPPRQSWTSYARIRTGQSAIKLVVAVSLVLMLNGQRKVLVFPKASWYHHVAALATQAKICLEHQLPHKS